MFTDDSAGGTRPGAQKYWTRTEATPRIVRKVASQQPRQKTAKLWRFSYYPQRILGLLTVQLGGRGSEQSLQGARVVVQQGLEVLTDQKP